MVVRPGVKLRSVVCATEVVVVKAPPGDVDIECGGQKMVVAADAPDPAGRPAPGADGGTLLGKRYVDATGAIELLCGRAGDGSLAVGGVAAEVKAANPLPSSD
jgi:hypothetical protein